MMENTMASYYEVGNSSNLNIYPNTYTSFIGRSPLSESTSNNTMIESGTTNNNNSNNYNNINNDNDNNDNSIPAIMLGSPKTSAEAKAVAACKTHKEAERRRRKRINAHLATLRTLLPNLIKTDKASVLAEVVRRVRELKKTTLELTANSQDYYDGCNACLFPGDMDEVNLQRSENDNNTLIATLCCEDRPELIVDLTRALRSVKGKVLKAEMATVGGRTKGVLWVCGVGYGGPEGLLRRALKVVVDKPSFSSSGLGHGLRMNRPY